jgi:hypothetical protein
MRGVHHLAGIAGASVMIQDDILVEIFKVV